MFRNEEEKKEVRNEKPCHIIKHIGRNVAKCDCKNKLILNSNEKPLVIAVLFDKKK